MEAYQEEYLSNVREMLSYTARVKPAGRPFEEYFAQMEKNRRSAAEKAERNMEILREELFPTLDQLFEIGAEQRKALEDFAGQLLKSPEELDVGLSCQIHRALLSLARLEKDRAGIIRELYWLGIGWNYICNRLVGQEMSQQQAYVSQMRLCFTEAAAYLKYYDEIEDSQTRGYILRCRANMSLGAFKSQSTKIRMVKKTLRIMQDEEFRKKDPKLPWDAFLYATHQQMAASLSHAKEQDMTPQDVTDVMESVYVVFQRQIQEAAKKQMTPPARTLFRLYAVEYRCGLDTLTGLLTKMEELIDMADPADFSAEGMYALISLPAFYCQYLSDYPELIPKRREYIDGLYRKILSYVDSFPEEAENENLFLYLRQLAVTFVETETSVSYGKFLQRLLMRFLPDVYIHSRIVGRTAAALSGMILEEENQYFDDIEWIRAIREPDAKKQAVMKYAMECGLFHDTGKINFVQLYVRTGRQWLEEEYEMAKLHAEIGAAHLAARPSTCRFAEAARGHHSWYDGAHGYPDSYKRLECPARQMVDVIALADWLENRTDAVRHYVGEGKGLTETLEEALAQEGKRFSPLLTARLRDKKATEKIRQLFDEGRREACRILYEEESGKGLFHAL